MKKKRYTLSNIEYFDEILEYFNEILDISDLDKIKYFEILDISQKYTWYLKRYIFFKYRVLFCKYRVFYEILKYFVKKKEYICFKYLFRKSIFWNIFLYRVYLFRPKYSFLKRVIFFGIEYIFVFCSNTLLEKYTRYLSKNKYTQYHLIALMKIVQYNLELWMKMVQVEDENPVHY